MCINGMPIKQKTANYAKITTKAANALDHNTTVISTVKIIVCANYVMITSG